MIEISKVTVDDIGRRVIYHRNNRDPEVGELTSVNREYIFVRFKGQTSEACHPSHVSFYPEPIESARLIVKREAQKLLRRPIPHEKP